MVMHFEMHHYPAKFGLQKTIHCTEKAGNVDAGRLQLRRVPVCRRISVVGRLEIQSKKQPTPTAQS
jgi:hypothetical protein